MTALEWLLALLWWWPLVALLSEWRRTVGAEAGRIVADVLAVRTRRHDAPFPLRCYRPTQGLATKGPRIGWDPAPDPSKAPFAWLVIGLWTAACRNPLYSRIPAMTW